jgi:AmmeMemoRadiSam system protein B
MKRMPAVAGKFYGGHPRQLAEEVASFTYKATMRRRIIGAISPHAGLMYSGQVAGAMYSSIEMPETFIILGPNHAGSGPDMAVMSSGEWQIPIALFNIDSELAASMLENMPKLTEDPQAHALEHSIEMQLPFLAYDADKIKIVPVVVGHMSLEDCAAAGKGMAAAIKKTGRNAVIIASSDMSHYVNDAEARTKDGLAIGRILDLDPAGLYSTVVSEAISMCGFLPAVIMLYAAIELGAADTQLIKYATSGEISGDYERVVGYVSITVK